MKYKLKVSPKEEKPKLQPAETEATSQAAPEFAQTDELLRFDAAHTMVPPEIAQRLQKSASQLPSGEKRPWWKSLLGD